MAARSAPSLNPPDRRPSPTVEEGKNRDTIAGTSKGVIKTAVSRTHARADSVPSCPGAELGTSYPPGWDFVGAPWRSLARTDALGVSASVPAPAARQSCAPAATEGYRWTVSTAVARNDATAPLVSGWAFPLHWPFFGPEVKRGA